MERAAPGGQLSTIRNIETGEVASTLDGGWIVPASQPTLSAQRDSRLDESLFNEFDISYSASSDTVTIDAGEGYVTGWVATDEQTDVTVPLNDTVTIVLGWNPDSVYDDTVDDQPDDADELYIDRASNVPSDVPTMELWEVTTDGSGVASVTDNRQIGSQAVVEKATVGTLEATTSLNDADISAASENDVIKKASNGNSLKFGKDQVEPNVPDWNPLKTLTDGDDTTALNFDTGDLEDYTVYKISISVQFRQDTDNDVLKAQINNYSNSDYNTISDNASGSTYDGAVSHWVVKDFRPTYGTTSLFMDLKFYYGKQPSNGIGVRPWPLIGRDGGAIGTERDALSHGELEQSNETVINSIQLSTDQEATGQLQVYGRDIQ